MIALTAPALEVKTAAGGLSGVINDMNITTLTVSGSMNAHDFYFISSNLHQLTSLNIGAVKVLPVTAATPYYWVHTFEADVLPVCAFSGMDLETVVLPSGLTGIGRGAFAGCKRLTSVTLPATLDSIGNYAFAGCESLAAVTLPARVEHVGCGAFMRCTSLASFAVEPMSRLNTIDDAALLDCPSLVTLQLGESLQEMGERVLAGAGIQQLDLTASPQLNSIGDWAFVHTPMTAARMPSSLSSLGTGAFAHVGTLATVDLGGGLDRLNDYTFTSTGLSDTLDLAGVAVVGDYALYNASQLAVVVLPSTVAALGNRAMAGMTGMTALTCEAEQVPALGDSVWLGVNQQQVPLTVPEASVEQYKATAQWQDFLFASRWLKGDVNADGEISVADINLLIDIILGRKVSDDVMMRADVNEDGEISVADINAVIELILHPENQGYAAPVVDTGDELHLPQVAMQPGDQRTLTVTLDNAGRYSAMQCDISLPVGLTLVGVGHVSGHEGVSSAVDGMTTRALTYSMSKRPFDNSLGATLSITVRADDALASESDIVLTNVVLADADNVAWHAADAHARVNNTTGIEDLAADADRVWVDGRTLCIDTRREGVAQLAAVNGMTRTVDLQPGMNRYGLEAGFYVVTLNGRSHKIAVK